MATLRELLDLIPDEYELLENVITRLAADFPDQLDEISLDRAQSWVDELASGDGRSQDELRSDIFQYIVTPEIIAETYGVNEEDAQKIISGEMSAFEASQNAPGAEGGEDLGGVMTGGQTIRVKTESGERWYQVYEWPPGSGSFISFQWNSQEQAEAAMGDGFEFTNWSENKYNNTVLAEAEAEQIVGTEGSFLGFMNEVMRDAAADAGIGDPTLVGKIAGNEEVQQILAMSLTGEWTQEQMMAELRKTDFWKNELYPGIEAFYGKTSNPEQAWVNYSNNVSSVLTELGYERDAEGTYNEQIEEMLNNGIDAETFLENAPIFMQAVQNQQFFQVLRQRAQAELGKDLEFGDWFDLLKGEAAPDIQRVAEGSIVAYEAQQQGTEFGEKMLQRLIAERDLTAAQARNVFQEVNQAVLALGESGLSRGNLTRDDIISAMADIQSAGGLNPEEVRLRVAKLARENDLFDEEKLSFFTGFTPQGTPFKPGLTVLNPEGA